jgi:hypothetical protein
MYNNDRQEEEKLRMIARLLYGLILVLASVIAVAVLALLCWRFFGRQPCLDRQTRKDAALEKPVRDVEAKH